MVDSPLRVSLKQASESRRRDSNKSKAARNKGARKDLQEVEMSLSKVKGFARAVATCALFIFSLSIGALAQDSAGSVSGSTSPDTYAPSRPKPPSTPGRRAAFAQKQFRKYAATSRKKALERNNLLFHRNVTLLPTGEVRIASANNLNLSSLQQEYEEELNFFAAKNVLLVADQFMKARFVEQSLKPRFERVEARTLLEGLLLKGDSFKMTLTTTCSVPPADAENAISKAEEILKSLK